MAEDGLTPAQGEPWVLLTLRDLGPEPPDDPATNMPLDQVAWEIWVAKAGILRFGGEDDPVESMALFAAIAHLGCIVGPHEANEFLRRALAPERARFHEVAEH